MKRIFNNLDFNDTRQSQGEKNGKGYWHDVSKAKDILCRIECPFVLTEWHDYEELEFKYSLLEEENKKLKKELKELKASNK